MKKTLLFFLFLLLACPLLSMNVTLEGKGGFFIPPTSACKRSMAVGRSMEGSSHGVSTRSWISMQMRCFLAKSGKSLGERRSTHIRILPVGIGLKGSLPFDPFEIYVAASTKHFTVKIHNNSPYVDQHQEKNGWGWGAKIGVSFFFANHFLLDLFLEYMRKEFSFSHSKKVESRKEVDIGGGVIGGALGYRF